MVNFEKILKYTTLTITCIYFITVLMGILALQGLGTTIDLEAKLFLATVLFFHPISILLIFLVCLDIVEKKYLKYVLIFVTLNALLLILQSTLIFISVIRGTLVMPLIIGIPSFLYIIYHIKYLRK